MKILVDADACPRQALQICLDVGNKHKIAVWTVASFNHNIDSDHHFITGNSAQEADIKLLNLTEQGDIVVTQDWGLAAMVLGKGAKCLSPAGRIFCEKNIDFLLEERELKAKFRRLGGRTKGPKPRTQKDDGKFRAALANLIDNSL